MASQKRKTLLLGLGSDILCDAGIGPKLARKIYSRNGRQKEIDLAVSTVGGMDLLHLMKPYQKVLIIDGILSKNIPPGKINIHYYPNCPESLHLSNGHDGDFSMLKVMAEISGIPFADEIIIITISVKDPFSVSDELSDELQVIFPDLVNEILKLLKRTFAP